VTDVHKIDIYQQHAVNTYTRGNATYTHHDDRWRTTTANCYPFQSFHSQLAWCSDKKSIKSTAAKI